MNRKISILAACMVLSISACQEDFILEANLPEPDPALVVNSVFRPDSLVEVYINTSAPLLGTIKPQAVTDARVEILSNDRVIDVIPYRDVFNFPAGPWLFPVEGDTDQNSENNRQIARYRSEQFKPVVGEEYSIRVTKEGFDTVIGSDSTPEVVPIVEAEYTHQTVTSELGERGEIRIVFDDPAGQPNYYNLRHHYRTIDTTNGFINSLTYGFDLLTDLQDDLFGANPDDLIQGRSSSSTIQQDGITFSDAFFDGQQKEIIIEVSDDICGAGSGSPLELQCQQVIEFSSVTEAFYEYHRTLVLQNASLQNPFAEPVRIKSNLSNEVGIFAGMNTSVWIYVQPR